MIDLHSHILPGVDDGSDDMDMSLKIANLYVENGINKVISTSHYIEGEVCNSPELLRKGIESLQYELDILDIPLEIYPGNEIYLTPNVVGKVLDGEILTLNDSNYVLIELPMKEMPIYVKEMIYELRLKGITPIIAHPERNSRIQEDPNILCEFINMGALAQLNLPSLEGLYGKSANNTAITLLQHNMIHFAGTDTHSNRRRSPKVRKSLEILSSLVSSEDFELITSKNAQSVLDNREIEIKSPRKVIKKGPVYSFFSALLSWSHI